MCVYISVHMCVWDCVCLLVYTVHGGEFMCVPLSMLHVRDQAGVKQHMILMNREEM